MGRFVYNQQQNKTTVDENLLRQSDADKDIVQYHSQTEPYVSNNSGFKPGNQIQKSNNVSHQKLSYLKSEIDFMVDGFMRELIDFDSFGNLDPQIQSEIANRYPQFFN
jgi:hypothetical protein